MRWLLIFLIFCAGCSRRSGASGSDAENTGPVQVGQKEPGDTKASIEVLRRAAEDGRPAAQSELAGRLLLGQGVNADPAAAVVWARKAALNGDETASLWTGRAALEKPDGRIEAAAWFLIGKTGGNAAIRQDAAGEIEALQLSDEELAKASSRAAKLKKTIRTKSK